MLTRLLTYKYLYLKRPGAKYQGVNRVTFMNRGMQNKKQRATVLVIIGIVLVSFLASIVAISIY